MRFTSDSRTSPDRHGPGCGGPSVRILAARAGRPAGDIQLRLIAAGLSAALSEAARYWAEQDGASPLTALMDQVVTTFEPLLEGLG